MALRDIPRKRKTDRKRKLLERPEQNIFLPSAEEGPLHPAKQKGRVARPPNPDSLKNRRRTEINRLKSSPCMDCGKRFPTYAMDFDHRDPKDKRFTISLMINVGSWEEFDAEVAKCDVICACCHRIRTHNRHQTRKNKKTP